MKIGKRVLSHLALGLCGALLTCGRNALALECHLNSESGITEETQSIGALTIPADLPIGSRLWTSEVMSRDVVCWAGGSVKGEWVYFYGNPVGNQVRPGIGLGLIYNDADLGVVAQGSKVQTDMYRKKNKPEKGTVRFQVYLEKTGEIGEGGDDTVGIFQLDGKGGINATPGMNYRYILQGFAGIQISTCSVMVDAPRELNFGTLSSAAGPGVIAVKDLTVTATKSQTCGVNEKLAIDLVFSAPNGGLVEGNTALDMANGSYFSLRDGGSKITFDSPIGFWENIQSGSTHQVSYQAELAAEGELQTGVANQSVVLFVNYR